MDTTCVFPPYCSFMEVLEILPFTGQHPTAPAARFPAAQARISWRSSSSYPFLDAKLFSDKSVSAMITTATISALPTAWVRLIPVKSGKISRGSPGWTACRRTTPYWFTWKTIVERTPAIIITIAIGNFGISFLDTIKITSAPIPIPKDNQFIFVIAWKMCSASSMNSPVPAGLPISFGICIIIIVTAIPLINPPITGVEIKSTILSACKR